MRCDERMGAGMIAAWRRAALACWCSQRCGVDDRVDSASSTARRQRGTAAAAVTAQAKAQAAIDKAKEVPQFDARRRGVRREQGEGMTIFNIPVSSAIPYVAAVDKEMQKIAKERGHQVGAVREPGQPDAVGVGHEPGHLAEGRPDHPRRRHRPAPAASRSCSRQEGRERQGARQPPVPERRRRRSSRSSTSSTATSRCRSTSPVSSSVQYAIAEGGCDAVKSSLIINCQGSPAEPRASSTR